MDSPLPAPLSRRARVWRRLAGAHADGEHHELLCRTAASCSAYDTVLRAQLDLVERALRLPEPSRNLVAEALDQPGRAPLRRLVAAAEADAARAARTATRA